MVSLPVYGKSSHVRKVCPCTGRVVFVNRVFLNGMFGLDPIYWGTPVCGLPGVRPGNIPKL